MRRGLWALALAGLLQAAAAACAAQGAAATATATTAKALPDTLSRPASSVARPERALLLGLARAGTRLVAVGERGLILLSDEPAQGQERQWRQVPVPVSVTLTAVAFATPTQGWAVGHRGVVLATADGGASWTLQLDGHRFAALALAEAQGLEAAGSSSPETLRHALRDAQALLRDGADKPFLALSFADARRGIAVGAYGLCAATVDGGRSWQSCMRRLDNPQGSHLYAIARAHGSLFIAGEQGLLLRGDDDAAGATSAATSAPGRLSAVSLPEAGSLFSLGVSAEGHVLAGGLRGKAFVSTDQGRHFEAITSESAGGLSSAVSLPDGRLLMASQLGQVLRYDAAARRLALLASPPTAPISDALPLAGDKLLVVGARGAASLALGATSVSSPATPTRSHP